MICKSAPRAEPWCSVLRYFLLTYGNDGARPLRPEFLIQQPKWLGDSEIGPPGVPKIQIG
jgi:hypothetical protein